MIDIIKNNTDCLVHQDMVSVFKKPPLDSMDLLRTKLLDLAKKNKIVFNAEKLDLLLDQYRSFLLECCDDIIDIRFITLSSKVKNEKLNNKNDIIKINKKDFMDINKKIRKILKTRMNDAYHELMSHYFDMIFVDSLDDSIKNKIIEDFSKYLNGCYQKQLLENCELKIMVKDTTLINSVKEQGDRYLFTLNHSRLLNESET